MVSNVLYLVGLLPVGENTPYSVCHCSIKPDAFRITILRIIDCTTLGVFEFGG